jgi:cysteine synthase
LIDVSFKWDKYIQVQENIFDLIGLTPLFRMPKVSERAGTNILGKIEWYSPTGSLKDRIYHKMIHEAIARGDLKPGMEIIESSTGNAGIACAFVGRMLDYHARRNEQRATEAHGSLWGANHPYSRR